MSGMDAFAAELEQALREVVTATDTTVIKAASDRLRQGLYKQAEVVPALIHILQVHPEPHMRQIAGVEARKVVSLHWGSENNGVPAQTMSEIRQTIMQSTLQEKNDLTRHTSARVIAAIAAIDLFEGAWPELVPSLLAAAQSHEANEREVAIYIIYALLDQESSESMFEASNQILSILHQTIKDPASLQVRVTSVLALGKLSELVPSKEGGQKVQPLIPSVVEVLSQAVQSDDEKSALQIFEVLNDLLLDDASMLGSFFGELVQHMVTQYALQTEVDNEYRNSALQFVYNAVRFRSKKIQSLQYGPVLTRAAIQILAEPVDEDDDDDDDDEESPSRLANRIIDLLSSQLPPSQVINPIVEMLPTLVNGTKFEARAGLSALAFSIEGAPDFITNVFETILPLIVQGLNHSSDLVKVAAMNSVVMLAVELPGLIGAEHEVLLPLVFSIMDGASSLRVGRSASSALDSILETLDRKVITEKYLNELVPKLLQLSAHYDDLKLKGNVVTAIGSAAFAAGRNFLPFFKDTVEVIQKYLVVPAAHENPSDDLVKLSSMTLDTLGTLCLAVGEENYAPILENSMTTVMSFLNQELPEPREAAFVFIGVASKVFKESFAPFVPHVIPKLLETFDLQEFDFDGDDLDDVGINDEEENLTDNLKVNSGVAIEKEFACDALGDVIVSVPPAYVSEYLPQTIKGLVELSEHFFEAIRRSAILALWKILTHYYVAEYGKAAWSPGQALGTAFNEPLQTIVSATWQATTELVSMDEDQGVVSTTFDAINSALRDCGPAIIQSEESLSALITEIFHVLEKKHTSQVDDEYELDGEDANLESTETDEALIDLALDLIVQVANVLGAAFSQIFPTLAKILFKYSQSKVASERTSGIGAIAELVSSMKSNVTPYTQELLETFATAMEDKKLAVRSVAAYGFGMLAYYSENAELVKSTYPAVLQRLQHLLTKVDKKEKRRAKLSSDEEDVHNDQRSLANACGCIARMSLKYPESIPLEQVIPALLARLPLVEAFEENEPILELLWKLTEQKHPVIVANAPELLQVVVDIFNQQVESDQQNSLKSIGEHAQESQLQGDDARKYANSIVKSIIESQPDIVNSYPSLSSATQ